MQHTAFVDNGQVKLVGAQARVCAGLAREAERAVAVLVEADEGQRREYVRIGDEPARVDARGVERMAQHQAEIVLADLAQKRRFHPQRRERCEKVAGRAAGVRRHSGIAERVNALLRKVYEHLADRGHVYFTVHAAPHFAAGYSLQSRR